MMLTDAGPFSPLFLLYPWMYVSYAVRYGIKHLYYISISCITAFIVILTITDTWYSHSLDASVYLIFLLMLPLYLKIILKRIVTEQEEKEQALKIRNEFLATVSHEIRTPMSGIIGMTALLERTELNEQQREYTSSLRSTSTVLHSLINDVLNISKLEANKIQLDLQAINLKEIVHDAVQVFAPRAKAKKIKLDCHFDNVPEVIIADANRLRQILINLISNAVKFTRKGAVHVTVSGHKKENDIWGVKFKITDTGSGIEEKHLSRVFEAFYQCSHTLNMPQQGTGLGTAIAKELVELMGGEIGLDSVYGHGSTFWFQLPLSTASSYPATNKTLTAENSAISPLKSLKILVAEDSPINAKVITAFLQDEGHTVILVGNGVEAIERLSTDKYDMVFMDMRMPNINGAEATKQWRQLEKEGSHTPIIALTANASPADRQLCLASGMDDFLVKPFSPEQLNNIMRKYI